MLSIPIIATTGSSDSLTASLSISLVSYTNGSLPCGIVLAGHKTFPALIMRRSYHATFLTPMGPTGAWGYFFPVDDSLHPSASDSTPICYPPKCYKGSALTMQQISLYAAA